MWHLVGKQAKHALAPIHVEVSTKLNGDEQFDTRIGKNGLVYPLNFINVLNLIQSRQGCVKKRLEYRP
jgi:hypothetical protein